MPSDNRQWSVPVGVDEIPETGSHHELTADGPTREAVAHAVGLRDLSKLDAVFDLTRRGSEVAVKGEVSARVGQTCVVTLDPIENEIREAVDLVFASPSKIAAGDKPSGDLPEPLENGVIDLGAIAIEFLTLGVDPYPRKPGAEFASAAAEPKGDSPFAALAGLKKRT